MTAKPIRNDDDLRRAFQRMEKIFQAVEDTPQRMSATCSSP